MMKKISSMNYAITTETDEAANVAVIPTSTILFSGIVIAKHETKALKYKAILKAIQLALRSHWFVHKIKKETQDNHLNAIRVFYDWINSSPQHPSYKLLMDFEVNEINSGIKPQSTRAKKIITLLRKGLFEEGLSLEEYRFLKTLCEKTKLVKNEQPDSINLGQWFAKHQWVRSEIGDDYHRLASPKRLIKSFVVTVASTLIALLHSRRAIQSNKSVFQRYLESTLSHSSSRKPQNLIAELLQEISLSNDFRMTQAKIIIEAECIKSSHRLKVEEYTSLYGDDGYNKILKGISSNYPYYRPLLFSSEKLSITEQLLMYFLLCSLAIQPTSAAQFTRNNFAFKRNKNGRSRYLRVNYKKGRGDIYHEPPILRTGEIVFEAIELYLTSIPIEENNLFSDNMVKAFHLTNPNYVGRKFNGANNTSTLFKLWSDMAFSETLSKQLKKHKTDDLFLKAFRCFLQPDVMTFNMWEKHNDSETPYRNYLASISKSCPQSLFTGTHIKNTSVYSRTDKYRDEDLVNTNSHSSLTEKLSYMTDNNKEWVNQVGRITRMVMSDIEVHAFSPNITGVEADVQDLKLKTKIMATQSVESAKINKIGKTIQHASSDESVVVIDSIENAVLMLNYIDQAEFNYRRFVEVNPEFLESTLLVNVEWMYHCLEQFCPKNVKAASEKFNKIKTVLPKLFEHELAEGVSL